MIPSPPQPPYGDPCNGCGLCCLAEQCSASADFFGPSQLCPALEYDKGRFWCGLMLNPEHYGALIPGLDRLGNVSHNDASARYWQTLIGGGKGCYSPSIKVTP